MDPKPISTKTIIDPQEGFQTAASELLTRTPGLVLRGPIYMVFIILFGTLLYSIWAEVDVRIMGPIILIGEEYIVQSPINGIVSEVIVSEEDRVSTGSKIALLESQEGLYSLEQMKQLVESEKQLKKQLLLEDLYVAGVAKVVNSQSEIAPKIVAEFLDLLKDRENLSPVSESDILQDELTSAEKKDLKTRIEAARLNIEMTTRELALQQMNLAAIESKYTVDKTLFEEQLITKIEMLNSQNAYDTAKESVAMTRRKLQDVTNSIVRQILLNSREMKSSLESVQAKIKQTGSIMGEIEIDDNYCSIFSHYSGMVTTIEVFQGQRIGAGTPIARIVRDSKPPIGKMYIANQDIANVEVGQTVRIKYDAYPYQEYGTQSGRIIRLSGDVQDVPGVGLVYVADISLSSYFVTKGNKKIPLRLGVRGLAEVVTGKKRMVELIFAPVSKLLND